MAAKSSQPKPSKSSSGDGQGFGTTPTAPKVKPKVVAQKVQPKTTRTPRSTPGIPEVVSRRMAKRMALFCGVPTLLGLTTFPFSYFVLFRNGIEVPNVAVLLTSLGGLGLGVLGLSYGVLSASWDERLPGSRLGWSEFRLNFGRLVENFKAGRDRPSA